MLYFTVACFIQITCGTSARLRRMNLTPGHLEFPTRDLFSDGVHNSDEDQDPCDKGLPFIKELTTVEDKNRMTPLLPTERQAFNEKSSPGGVFSFPEHGKV